MKLVEWNIHKMTRNIPAKQFVIDTLKDTDADIICLVEYTTDTGIEKNFERDYWCEESNTKSGNKVFIAVRKTFVPDGITVIGKDEMENCYNFLHIEFSTKYGDDLSFLGVRMLSPQKGMNAKIQTPPLVAYISGLKNTFLCAGDFNIKDSRMGKWFPGSSIQNITSTNRDLSKNSYIYTEKEKKITGFGAIDHVLHSNNIQVNSRYDWNFLSRDSHYLSVEQITKGSTWSIPPSYPDHALMISDFEIIKP